MNERDEENESLADWLFFARKHRRRRTTHTTRTIGTTQNTDQEDKN